MESSLGTFLDVRAMYSQEQERKEQKRQETIKQLSELTGLQLRYVLEQASNTESDIFPLAVTELLNRVKDTPGPIAKPVEG